jgi:membrane fusion protein (multidrug efflux system)
MTNTQTQSPAVPARPARTKIIVMLAVAIGLSTAAWYTIHTIHTEKTDDAALEAAVVPIAPKVSGYVVELSVADNQHVKAGDVLLQIAPQDYILARDLAQADLNAAEARLDAAQHSSASIAITAPSSVAAAHAQLEQTEAEWQNAAKNLKRLQAVGDLARTGQSLDNAIAEERSTRSKLNDAQARLTAAQIVPDTMAIAVASIKELTALVERGKTNLALAEKNLQDTKLIAPIDGRVSKRTVEQGAYLQPGQQVLSLVGDSKWVIANFKETQINGMKKGQAVDIVIDAYPDQHWAGTIDSIQSGTGARFTLFPPENATGNFIKIVQRVPVKITFNPMPDDALLLGPGMSVTPVVHLQ